MTAPGHHPGSPCRHRDRGAVALYGHDVKHGTAAADHLPASCGTTARVRAALANIQRYVQSLPAPPQRVVLSRSVYQELSAAAKGEPIDFDGIPLESR